MERVDSRQTEYFGQLYDTEDNVEIGRQGSEQYQESQEAHHQRAPSRAHQVRERKNLCKEQGSNADPKNCES